MSASSVSHAEKVASRSTFNDWEVRSHEFKQTTQGLREKAIEKRSDSNVARIESAVQTRWDAYHNEDRLTKRISEVSAWNLRLEQALSAQQHEERRLADTKANMEDALHFLFVPLQLAQECVSHRDGRPGAELTRDDVGVELQQELSVLERHKSTLLNLGMEAWQQTERLAATREALILALGEQEKALQVDKNTRGLSMQAPGLAYRPEPRRLAPESAPPESWEAHCLSLAQRSASDIASSTALRGDMCAAVELARNATLAQQETTDRALRLRAFQIQSAIDELEWQRKQLLEEMQRVQTELARLREAERSLDLPRRLCETRHELRTSRPAGPERCQDDAQYGLAEESRRLEASRRRLQNNIAEARTAYSSLRAQLSRTELDLQDKRHALALENRCESTRKQIGERTTLAVTESHSAQL